MISSTANVAIPAARPERRISGQPDDEREHAADERREQRATARCRSCGRAGSEEVRHHRRLLLHRHGEHAAVQRPDGDEADVPEREHAGVADEDVERDDDRDRDERVDEVDLGRAREERPDHRDDRDEHRGRESRQERHEPSHTRSTGRAPARRTGPPGRTSSTRITSAEQERRQVLALVGRQRAAERARTRSRSRTRRASPTEPVHPADDDAGEHDDRLPEREVRRDERVLHRQHHRDGGGEHPREQHGGADHAVRADAEQPRRREVHRGGAHLQADLRPPEEEHERRRGRRPRRRSRRRDLADVDAPDRPRPVELRQRRRGLAERVVPTGRRAARSLCSRNATANVATSIAAGDCVRSGRKTTRSIASESAITTREAETMPEPTRPVRLRTRSASANAPAMTSCP